MHAPEQHSPANRHDWPLARQQRPADEQTLSAQQSQLPRHVAPGRPQQYFCVSSAHAIDGTCRFDAQMTAPAGNVDPQHSLVSVQRLVRPTQGVQAPPRHSPPKTPGSQNVPSGLFSTKQARSRQTPCVHWSLPGHSSLVQQLAAGIHVPAQAFCPAGHDRRHAPPEHVSPALQARPHEPQFAGSDCTSRQRFPHLRFGGLHFFLRLAPVTMGSARPDVASRPASERRGRRAARWMDR